MIIQLALERVASACVALVKRFQASGACVDEYLQDQLLLPMSFCGGRRFMTTEPSLRTRTNMDVIGSLLDVGFGCWEIGPDLWEISVNVLTERSTR